MCIVEVFKHFATSESRKYSNKLQKIVHFIQYQEFNSIRNKWITTVGETNFSNSYSKWEKTVSGTVLTEKKQLIFVISIMQNKKSVTYKIIINLPVVVNTIGSRYTKKLFEWIQRKRKKRKKKGKRKRDN